jgi:arylsulfatase A-like enzyme
MKNSLFITTLISFVVLISCNAQKSTPSSTAEDLLATSNEGKKNILFIAVDDLKPLLSNYGETQMVTPNFDRLAKMGMTFTNAHVQQAVCGPSRASVMTGTFPDRTKVWDLHTDFRESAPDLISMPEYLISQGFETFATGKIYHKGSTSPGHDGKSWSIPYREIKNFNKLTGTPALNTYQNPESKKRIEELMTEAEAKGIKKFGKKRKYVIDRFRPSTESADVPDDAYLAGNYTRVTLEQIEAMSKSDKPYFIAVGYQKPHLPFVAPKKYWDLYNREEIKLAKFQKISEGTPLFAFHSFGELRAYSDIDDNLDIGDVIDENKQRELIHGYMACISYIDAQIGVLLDKLESTGTIDDTIIVLWGDHGWHLGDHTEWCKHSNFEQATRIPFMFAGPSVEKNSQSHQPVNLVDLFPTVFELAGVPIPKQVDGKSLFPLMDNNDKTSIEMDYAISQYPRGKRMGYSLRTDRYRYTEWHNNDFRSYTPYDNKNLEARELYDYEKDPLETKNLVNDPKYSKVVEQLQQKIRTHLDNQFRALN